jgi:hypothetical protein
MAYSGSTAAILSNYSEVLKVYYLPAIQEQLQNENILSSFIDTNEEDVSGKSATIECHYGRSNGGGSRADGDALPEADYQKFKTCIVPMRYDYGRVTFSGPTIAATRDDKGSYARVIDTEIRGIATDRKKEVNRMMWGAGYSMLARWATGATTTITVNKLYRGNAIGGDGFGSTFGGKYFDEFSNMVLVNQTAMSSASAIMTVGSTNGVVTAVDKDSSTLIDTLTLTTDAGNGVLGDWYARKGSVRSATTITAEGYPRLEMMGIRGIVTNEDLDEINCFTGAGSDTGGLKINDPLQTLDVSTYPWWKSQVEVHASGRYAGQRALTLKLMQKMFDKVEQAAGKDYGPDMIITTRSIRREYLDRMQADRRNVNTMTLDGGWTALDYNGIPLMVDNDAIDGEMYFLTLKDLVIFRMSDWDWMTKDGAILSRISDYDAYEAVLFRYAELATRRRNSHGVLCDLAYESDR